MKTVPNISNAPARVLVIDDHPLFRKGVRQLIELDPGLICVGEADSGEQGLVQAKTLEPDLILLDLNMKGMDGIATLQRMRAHQIDARIVILTVSDAAEHLVAAIRAGADGYLLKDTEPEDLLQALHQAMYGRTTISPELSSLLASTLRAEALDQTREQTELTEREQQILQLLAAGKSNKLIARELDIMESTVKVHIRNLLKKMQFRSRLEAAVWAVAAKDSKPA
ncbi:MAG: two-component system response regulator NarL [Herbaspirillum sp.]